MIWCCLDFERKIKGSQGRNGSNSVETIEVIEVTAALH